MPIPVIETSTQNEGTDIANLTLTKPSGVVSGNTLLIICMNENTGASEGFGAITSETGWTQIFNEGNATSDSYVAAYWRESDGADDATVDVPLVTTQSGGGFYLRVSGADTADLINIIGTFNDNGGSTTPITAASVTTDAADCLVFGCFTFDGGDGGTISTSGTGWPTAVDDQYDIGTNSGSQGAYVTKELASASASSAVTFSASAQQDQCGAIQFAINGAADAGIDISVPAGATTTTEPAPTIETGVNVAVPVGTTATTEPVPAINISINIAVPAGATPVTEPIPTLETTAEVVTVPAAGTPTTEPAPTISLIQRGLNRRSTVPYENRTSIVPPENRLSIVPYDNRLSTVPPAPRLSKVSK